MIFDSMNEKSFLFLSIKKEGSFKKAEGELMTVGNVVNLLFSFPHYPQLSRGRCLLGAKRFLGSLKYSAWMRSIISGDAIAPA